MKTAAKLHQKLDTQWLEYWHLKLYQYVFCVSVALEATLEVVTNHSPQRSQTMTYSENMKEHKQVSCIYSTYFDKRICKCKIISIQLLFNKTNICHGKLSH
jgi:hypothetical protein